MFKPILQIWLGGIPFLFNSVLSSTSYKPYICWRGGFPGSPNMDIVTKRYWLLHR